MQILWSTIDSRKKIITAVAVLFVLGVVLYANILHNGFIWDDHFNIENNTSVKSLNNIGQYFSQDLVAGAGETVGWYRPLLLLSYAFDYQIWGLNVVGYHSENVLIHIASAIILFFVVIRLLRRVNTAFIASLLFLAHPIQTEAIAYMSGRADLLMVFFLLLSLYLFLLALAVQNPKKRLILTAAYLASFILALLSKETAVVFPALLAVVYISFVGINWSLASIKTSVLKVLPTIFASVLFIILRSTAWNFSGFAPFLGGQAAENTLYRIGVFVSIMPEYFKMLLLPINLHYRVEKELLLHFWSLKFLFSITSLFFVIFLIWKWKARQKLLIFGFGWFLVSLLPTSNIFVGINFLVGERWLYLAAIGLFMGAAVLISDLLDNKKIKGIVIISLCALFVSYGIIVVKRNMDWRNEITFFSKELEYYPNNAILHGSLGMAYADSKQKEKAYDEFWKSIELDPNFEFVHYHFAQYAQRIGDMETAVAEYKKLADTIQFTDETFVVANLKLINFFTGLKAYDEALVYAKAIQDKFPNSWESYYVFAQIYVLQKNYQKARENVEKAIELNPGDPRFHKILDTLNNTK